MSESFEQVKEVTADLLKIDASEIKPESQLVEELGASSMKTVELVAALEDEFDVEIDEEQALKIKTVGDAAAMVDELLD